VVAAVGQEVFFRGTLTARLGPWATALVWALVTRPLDPAMGLLGGALLGWCHHRGGLRASLFAHVTWVMLVALG
jgi:membrane protease YdiL (CAAX protease family)